MSLAPTIYVTCLAAYNNGHLHGRWIDAHQSIDALQAEVRHLLATSPTPQAEEWAIHGYENFGECYINEYETLETIAALAAFIVEQGELGAALLAHTDNDIAAAHRLLEECYYGDHDTEADFAEHMTLETTTLPDDLAFYIDYERMAGDLLMTDFFAIRLTHRVHVFSNY